MLVLALCDPDFSVIVVELDRALVVGSIGDDMIESCTVQSIEHDMER